MSTTNTKHTPGGQDDIRSATVIDSLPERARLQLLALYALYDETKALREAVEDREAGIRNVKRGWGDCETQLAESERKRAALAEALRLAGEALVAIGERQTCIGAPADFARKHGASAMAAWDRAALAATAGGAK